MQETRIRASGEDALDDAVEELSDFDSSEVTRVDVDVISHNGESETDNEEEAQEVEQNEEVEETEQTDLDSLLAEIPGYDEGEDDSDENFMTVEELDETVNEVPRTAEAIVHHLRKVEEEGEVFANEFEQADTATSALSDLFYAGLLDRDSSTRNMGGGWGYLYSITSNGGAFLNTYDNLYTEEVDDLGLTQPHAREILKFIDDATLSPSARMISEDMGIDSTSRMTKLAQAGLVERERGECPRTSRTVYLYSLSEAGEDFISLD